MGQAEYGFRRVRILDSSGQPQSGALEAGTNYTLELACQLPPSPGVNVGFTLYNDAEIPAVSGSAQDNIALLPAGGVSLQVALPIARLPSGRYRVEGAVWDRSVCYDQSDALLAFEVVNSRSALDVSGVKPRGATLLNRPWKICPGS